MRAAVCPYRQVCARQIPADTWNDLSLCAIWRNSFQPNPQAAELEAPKAPHGHHHLLSFSWSHQKITFNIENKSIYGGSFSNPEQKLGKRKVFSSIMVWIQFCMVQSRATMPSSPINRCPSRVFLMCCLEDVKGCFQDFLSGQQERKFWEREGT